MAHPAAGRENLPGGFEEKYTSGELRERIADLGTRPNPELVHQIRKLYAGNNQQKKYCTFTFDAETVVRFDGMFLDDLENTIDTIRGALKNRSSQIRRNGEGLINFMQRVMA